MARVEPVVEDQAPPQSRELLMEQVTSHGRATNMKRTLAHSPTALFALMQWYDLHTEVNSFLGTRLTTLFAFGISAQTDCLICSTFFRRWLTEAGEDPDRLIMTPREHAVVEFGRQLARDANAISDDLYARATMGLAPEQVVALVAFGGMMIATNVFNNALKVNLDEYLFPFRKGAT
jgi:alkylhydroperoxidase family enzyme